LRKGSGNNFKEEKKENEESKEFTEEVPIKNIDITNPSLKE